MAADWVALRMEFVNTPITFGEMAKNHGLKEPTIRQRAHREGWAADRHTMSNVVTKQAEAKITVTRVDELAKFNAEDLIMAQAIRAKAASMMQDDLSPQDLRALAGAVDAAQKVGRLALGVSTDNLGHAGQNGEGPIAVSNVPIEEYNASLQKMFSLIQ